MMRLLFLIPIVLASTAAVAEHDPDEALAISQAAIGRHLGEHNLRDIDGQSFSLAALQGKPLLVSMIYTSCHHICPLITRNLATTVDIAADALGEDSFAVVTVGFDWKVDTPERMRQYARQQGVDNKNWYFLSADSSSVETLSGSLGFQFFPSAKGFDHLAQTTVVDADGVIYRQVYGVKVGTQSLVEPLKELVYNTPRSASFASRWFDKLKLFCTVYDPTSDRYRFDYSIFMTILVGFLSLGAIATFIVKEWRRAR